MKVAIVIAIFLIHATVALRGQPKTKPQCINEPKVLCLDPKTIKCPGLCIINSTCAYCNVKNCPTSDPKPECPAMNKLCLTTCHYETDANGCSVCVCPPPGSKCPQLRTCRPECSYAIDEKGCPKCDPCPVKEGCPKYKCSAGSILGNPGEDGCDTCVPPPKNNPDIRPCPRIACREGCKYTPEINGQCPKCIDCPPCPEILCKKGCTMPAEIHGFKCPTCQCPKTYADPDANDNTGYTGNNSPDSDPNNPDYSDSIDPEFPGNIFY